MRLHVWFSLVGLLAVAACADGGVSPTLSRFPLQQPWLSTAEIDCPACVFSPKTYIRAEGTPFKSVETFPGDPAASYLIDIDDEGTQGSDGVVALNGAMLLTSRAQGETGPRHVTTAVRLLSSNSLSVRLTGRPGSSLRIFITQCSTSLVSVVVGEGVLGEPQDGTQIRGCGRVVPFSFSLARGFANLGVSFDGHRVGATGSVIVGGTAQLVAVAHSQPTIPVEGSGLELALRRALLSTDPLVALKEMLSEARLLRSRTDDATTQVVLDQVFRATIRTAADSARLSALTASVAGELLPLDDAQSSGRAHLATVHEEASAKRQFKDRLSLASGGRQTAVVYINGVWNTFQDFMTNCVAFDGTVTDAAMSNTKTWCLYNQSGLQNANELGCALTEVASQFFNATLDKALRRWDGHLLNSVCTALRAYGRAQDIAQAVNQQLRAALSLAPDPKEVLSLAQKIRTQMFDQGLQVILVPHSQGNLHVRDIFRLSNSPITPQNRQMMGILALAAPSDPSAGASVAASACFRTKSDLIFLTGTGCLERQSDVEAEDAALCAAALLAPPGCTGEALEFGGHAFLSYVTDGVTPLNRQLVISELRRQKAILDAVSFGQPASVSYNHQCVSSVPACFSARLSTKPAASGGTEVTLEVRNEEGSLASDRTHGSLFTGFSFGPHTGVPNQCGGPGSFFIGPVSSIRPVTTTGTVTRILPPSSPGYSTYAWCTGALGVQGIAFQPDPGASVAGCNPIYPTSYLATYRTCAPLNETGWVVYSFTTAGSWTALQVDLVVGLVTRDLYIGGPFPNVRAYCDVQNRACR